MQYERMLAGLVLVIFIGIVVTPAFAQKKNIYGYWQLTEESNTSLLKVEPKGSEYISIFKIYDNSAVVLNGFIGRLRMFQSDIEIQTNSLLMLKRTTTAYIYYVSDENMTLQAANGDKLIYRRLTEEQFNQRSGPGTIKFR